MYLEECRQQRPLLQMSFNDCLQAYHGSVEMQRLQFAAHHFKTKKHAVGGEDIGEAVSRHFVQPAGRHECLDLAAVDTPIFAGIFANAAISARLGLVEPP